MQTSGLYLDIGGTNFRWFFESESFSEQGSFATDASFIVTIESLVEKFKPTRLGASFAGQVHDGAILSAPNISTSQIDFEQHFKDKYNIDCKIDNDLKCAILAESAIRKDVKNIALLYIGTGFGCAILENSKVLRGCNNFAGEIGHIPFRRSNRVCGCGKSDCLELFCSGTALQQRMQEIGYKEAVLSEMLHSIDTKIQEVVEDFTDGLHHAISTVRALFDPELIIFGGGIAQNNIQFIDKIIAGSSNKYFTMAPRPVKMEVSQFASGSLEGSKLLFI